MHNLKELRKNLETFKKKFKDRNLDFNTDEFNNCLLYTSPSPRD